ncbi:ABC transporter ATP-binding protein [Bradyrhizobium sp. DASA03007]|uniref:ABC transporter ATP-binding protein n=1 Tax=unclassified Bradyrhizobium TaxID=2631580 RepID=UPI003F713065
MSFIEVHSLSAGYNKSCVLREIDLSVEAGEAVAIVGKNGAGKSTFLNSFFGGTTVHGGAIYVGGKNLCVMRGYRAALQGVMLSPQGRMILSHLTVEENLLLGSASRRKGNWDLGAVYELFPILRERNRRMGTELSGGQQQMLAIGRALLGNPAVLLLDEPTEGLSPVLVDELVEVLNRIRETGTGIVVVEQQLGLVRRVTRRFVIMSKGQIVDRGDTADIDSEKHRAKLAF